jgi:hypothetical protein
MPPKPFYFLLHKRILSLLISLFSPSFFLFCSLFFKNTNYRHFTRNFTDDPLSLHAPDHKRYALATQELSFDGYEITPEILAGLSPYRTYHINKYGKYSFDLDRKAFPLNYKIPLIG